MVTNELSKFDFVKYGSELSAIHPISSCSVEESIGRVRVMLGLITRTKVSECHSSYASNL